MAAMSGDMSMCGVSIVFLLALETEFGYICFAIASISFSVSRTPRQRQLTRVFLRLGGGSGPFLTERRDRLQKVVKLHVADDRQFNPVALSLAPP
jgi:hypothetical protein